MNNPSKKKPAKKRAYVKKSDKWTRNQTISAIENKIAVHELTKPDPVKSSKDTEVQALAAICSIFDKWTPEQRKRNLEYITGKYYDFS